MCHEDVYRESIRDRRRTAHESADPPHGTQGAHSLDLAGGALGPCSVPHNHLHPVHSGEAERLFHSVAPEIFKKDFAVKVSNVKQRALNK